MERIPTVKKCGICGKAFIPAPLHIYRDKRRGKNRYVCSYGCMLRSERLKQEKERVTYARLDLKKEVQL